MQGPYKPVDFTNTAEDGWEIITTNDLNQVSENLQWIKDNTPRMTYHGLGATNRNVTSNIIIVGGKVEIPANRKSDSVAKEVRYKANTFLSGSHPHVLLGIEGAYWSDYHKLHAVVQGRGGKGYPDHIGFRVHVNNHALSAANDKMVRMIRVHWIAIGQQPAKNFIPDISAPIAHGASNTYPYNANTGAQRAVVE